MFARILVPVDLSERNAPALDTAAELAAAGAGTLLILHVIEEIEDVGVDELAEFYQGLRVRAEKALDAMRAQLEGRGASVATRIETGKRGAEIVRCAEDEGCDLVVLRSHVLDLQHPVRGLGTISHQVALACRCAVLLVR